jgi:hypothetical protein
MCEVAMEPKGYVKEESHKELLRQSVSPKENASSVSGRRYKAKE